MSKFPTYKSMDYLRTKQVRKALTNKRKLQTEREVLVSRVQESFFSAQKKSVL